MKYSVKKLITLFISIVVSVLLLANCIFVAAYELSDTVEPYNDEKTELVLEDAEVTVPQATTTLDTVIKYDPFSSDNYDLELYWGDLVLTYVFEVDDKYNITGGSWGESFDGTNNKIIIKNNSSQKIEFTITYITSSDITNTSLQDYSAAITLSDTYDPTNTDAPYGSYENLNSIQTGELEAANDTGENANIATLYIYHPYDLYTEVKKGAMPYPTKSIACMEVGVITVETYYGT